MLSMQENRVEHGILGKKAFELQVPMWVDIEGSASVPRKLKDLSGKFKVIYCFQAWCPGCHSKGLPDLKRMVDALHEDDHVAFLAIQTVFEGVEENTFKRMVEIQKEYNLQIPFGHDAGNGETEISSTMINYRTGGTPWFIFIDENDVVVFNDYHLDVDKAIDYLLKLNN